MSPSSWEYKLFCDRPYCNLLGFLGSVMLIKYICLSVLSVLILLYVEGNWLESIYKYNT